MRDKRTDSAKYELRAVHLQRDMPIHINTKLVWKLGKLECINLKVVITCRS